MGKPLPITKRMVWEGYLTVKRKGKAAGVDGQSLEHFSEDLENNLYQLWNRLASGSYFPSPVRQVDIPKKDGSVRSLGIPTVADRVAQMVVKQHIEPSLEAVFHADSYGYRRNRCAHDAIESTRQRCWRFDWVVDLDIKGFFDSIDHGLMMRALRKHVEEPWVLLYVERWLKAPVQSPDGQTINRDRGTPQGGVISPLLANLFLHYAFDRWVERHLKIPFERYADDIVCHCRTKVAAERVKAALEQRLGECGLRMHPDKTRIVYCKDSNRQGSHPDIQFNFLGFCFRPRMAKNRQGEIYTRFLPAVSSESLRRMRERIRSWRIHKHALLPLSDIAKSLNRVLRGWWQYYGKFYKSAMRGLFEYFDERLGKWLRCKYKRFKGRTGRSLRKLNEIARAHPNWFVHWQYFGRATVG